MAWFYGFLTFSLIAVSSAYVPEEHLAGASTKRTSLDLYKHLFKNYDKNVRPVKNFFDSITTKIGLTFLSLTEVDEEKEILVMDAWITMTWTDDYLTWNPDDYDGIKELRIPSSEIWKPDVTTYTASPDKRLLPQVFTNVIVNSTGEVIWVPPLTISTRCPLDLSDYPDDIQLCVIKLGSWTFSKQRMDLQMYDPIIGMRYFSDNNPEWSMLGAIADRFDKRYPCCPNETYPVINFNVTLKRKQSAPMEVARSISYFAGFLAVLMFCLPPDTVYKVILGALAEILIGITVLYVGTVIPTPAARLKAACKIYPFMCAISGALILEVLVMNVARVMGPCRPPRCLLAVAKGCCTLCCVCISRPYPGGDLRVEAGHSDKMKKRNPSAQEEWNLVAMALDRLLFFVAMITSIFFYKLY